MSCAFPEKRIYIPPEFDFMAIKLIEDVLGPSTDANTDHNNPGGGLFDNGTNPDIGNDNFDLDDGDW